MIGIQTVHRARQLFREHCSATPEPMSHLRMGGMHRRFIGGTAGQSGWVSNFPAGCDIPKSPRAREVFPACPRVSGRAKPASREAAGHAADRNRCTLQRLSQKPRDVIEADLRREENDRHVVLSPEEIPWPS